jgi:hypothetical protein
MHFLRTYEDALDGVAEVLLGKGHHARGKQGRRGRPVVKPARRSTFVSRVHEDVTFNVHLNTVPSMWTTSTSAKRRMV